MRSFLIAYRRSAGRIVRLVGFGAGLHRDAIEACFDAEREFRDDRDVEVVVLHADSLETVKRTHGRYFLGEALDVAPMPHQA